MKPPSIDMSSAAATNSSSSSSNTIRPSPAATSSPTIANSIVHSSTNVASGISGPVGPGVGASNSNSSSSSSTTTPTHTATGVVPAAAGATTAAANNSSSSAGASPSCFIKPSLSLNSLPPQGHPEGSEMAQHRLRIDRPYNSLKKKRDTERELWRRSWGSGHSHSSCSLQSSTTNTGLGKDDFWAALQTNYNFIMDTNLLDSCREARGEIEGTVCRDDLEDDDVNCCRKALFKPAQTHRFYGDPRLLRQWIKEMENRVARVPSVTETKRLRIEQLQKLAVEHGEIYREIKSNSRAVAACIRSYERDRKSASSASGKGSLTPDVEASLGGGSSSNSTSGHNNNNSNSSVAPTADGKGKENGGGGVKGLERRYHLLYLKAFEIQCLLEGLLDSKTSSSDNNASLSDTDEEPANKLARVSSSSIKSQGSNHNDTLNNEEWVKVKKLSNAGFDADSEGSDSEIVPKIIAYSGATVGSSAYNNTSSGSGSSQKQQEEQIQYHPGSGGILTSSSAVPPSSSPSSGNLMMEADINNLSTTTTLSDATTLTQTSSTNGATEVAALAAAVLKENILNNNNTTIESEKSLLIGSCDLVDGAAPLLSSTGLDVVNNNASVNGAAIVPKERQTGKGSLSNAKSSSPIGSSSGKQKRSKVSDSSKFNRSNRKSKNCATFYFKHLDTDSELNKDSSERTKSDASSSPGTSSPSASSSEGDDEWVYNNGGGEEEEEEDDDDLLAVRKRAEAAREAGEEEEKENKPADRGGDKHQREELAVSTGALKMTAGREPKSKKCLDFSRDASQKGGQAAASTPNGRSNGGGGRSLMMTSIGSFGKGTESVNGGTKGSKYATSSIQRLVLHAETLVRDEIFAKNAAAAAAAAAVAGGGSTPKTVVKNPHYYNHHHHHHHHNYSANNSSSNNSSSSHHHPVLPVGLIAVETGANRHGAASTAHSQHHHHHHHHGHGRKAEKAMSNLKMNLIEEWLEKQPLDAPVSAPLLPASAPTTDCEASGEYTDSDSIARDTDSSEGLANSVATCLQGEQTQTSQELLNDGTSYPSENSNDDEGVATDSKGGSSGTAATAAGGAVGAGGVTAASSSPSLSTSAVHGSGGAGSVSTVVKRRPHRSATDRPWSVSCMSQLNASSVEINQYGGGGGGGGGGGTSGPDSAGGSGGGGNDDRKQHSGSGGDVGAGGSNDSGNRRPLTDHRNYSISESALNTMARAGSGSSMVGSRGSMKPTSSQQTVVRNAESKGSLKKRKLRPRRKNRIDESGSDESQPPHHSSSTLHLLQQSLLLQYNALAAGSAQPLREIQLSGTGGSNSSVAGGGVIATSRRLLKSESFSGRLRLSDDLLTLSSLSGSSSRKSSSVRQTTTAAAARSSSKRSQDSEEEFGGAMAKPEFRIGSLTRTRCGSLNLGSLAALANYNLDGVEKAETDLNGTGTGTEEMSSFSEQAWDNYQEKYMSEPYSEDRDTDAARRLLDFGDDYRNFIDSQSDCASSSLSAANMDSLSPPRFRLKSESANKSETNANSLNRRKRLDEYRMDDRYGNNMNSWSSKSGSPPQSTSNISGRKNGSLSFLEGTPLAPMAESSGNSSGLNGLLSAGGGGGGGTTSGVRRRSLRSVDKHNSSAAFVRSLSHETSSSSNNEFDEDMEAEVKKLLIQSKIRFANTEALKAKCHLLKPDDYSEIITTCRENVRCLESVLRCQPGTVLTAAKCQDLRDTIVCWEGLLNWSERRVISNQFLDDIRALKDVLEELGSKTFNICSESHIQLAIDQLKNEHKVLQNQRPKMLTLNATVHNWVSNQEQQRKELLDPSVDARLDQLERDKNFDRCIGGHCGECYDCLNDIRLDTSVNRELKYGITTLYSTWDEAEVRLRNRIENLTTSMMTWKQLEDGLSDFRNTLDRDRGKLQGIEGALQSGGGTTEEIVNSVKEVVKALSEKVDPLFQQQQQQQQNGAIESSGAFQQQQQQQLESPQENLQQLLVPALPACVKLSSNGSLSDSGISDGGGMSDGSLSERERRLNALKRLVKQLEVALAPGSDAMQTIKKRLEMAEHDLRSLQSTCRKIIMSEKNQQEQRLQAKQQDRPASRDSADGNNNNNSAAVKNKNKKSPSRKKHRNGGQNRSQSNTSAEATENEDDEHLLQQQKQQQEELQREHLLAMQKTGQLGIVQTTKMKLSQNRWVWRITKIAVPVQLALVLVMCAACFFEPHCCDALNTYSMSLTPQLRYMKGPPPI
ncbi:klarsicht protein isoform X1 [Anopheles gambiae]|uniref:klarsicht protein isoform X1 n=1 Tax=Anopheles gambiae TaxID=7165 RepID=UPI002AC8B178|nr:klarsicht protein isoform X1 [Anopheles gambiae]